MNIIIAVIVGFATCKWIYPWVRRTYIQHRFIRRSLKKICKEKGYKITEFSVKIGD